MVGGERWDQLWDRGSGADARVEGGGDGGERGRGRAGRGRADGISGDERAGGGVERRGFDRGHGEGDSSETRGADGDVAERV